MKKHFFDHGFDVIFTSESEQAIVAFAQWLKTGSPAPAELRGLSFRDGDRIIDLPPPELAVDLDVYPMPSWHKLPNERYWEIARPFGGLDGWFEPGKKPRYASMFTSRGCPFRCTYCHISLERGGQAGDIGNLRLHSVDRFEQELHRLRDLGVELLYINDDSFLAKRARVLRVVEVLRRFDFKIADVNGVNIIHRFKRQGGKLVVDDELLEALYSAGFRRFGLPFEAGSQRMLDKYSTSKWRIAECDVETLVRKMRDIGILVDGNFIIGYPDETLEELTATFLLARRGMDAGLFGVQFFMCQPFPGTKLFAESLANGQLPQDWHWDRLGWSKGSPFTNPIVDRDTLKYCWSLVWQLLNPPTKVREIQSHMPSEMT